MSTVYFRADGNKEIATGHIMRCLSIARACTTLNARVHFLVSDQESLSLLKERFLFPDEFPIHCLQSNYRDMEAELPSLRSILEMDFPAPTNAARNTGFPCLFIDSYFVTAPYLSALQKICKVAYLDDILAFDYPVDCIINYDVTTIPDCYQNASECLLGPAYTPLREQFQNVSYEVRPAVRNILLSTGGTDPYNVAGTLLTRIFTTFSDISVIKYDFHVITSRLNSHFQELERLSSIYPAIHIHENVQDMASLMGKCDLAVSAGGTTLYELCAVGVPSIGFSMADNQLLAVETLSSKAIIPYAGDIRSSSEDVIHNVLAFLEDNIASYGKRQKSSLQMRAFIDGNGSARIAAALIRLSDSLSF